MTNKPHAAIRSPMVLGERAKKTDKLAMIADNSH